MVTCVFMHCGSLSSSHLYTASEDTVVCDSAPTVLLGRSRVVVGAHAAQQLQTLHPHAKVRV